MFRYALRKFLYGLAVMGGVVIVVFVLFNILPGDPARMTMGQRSDLQSLEAVRKEFGLDKPKTVQFFLYLNDLSPLSFYENNSENKEKYHFLKVFSFGKQAFVLKWPYLRRSYQTKRNVTTILWETVPNTFVLALTAMIFATVTGVFLGVISAVNKDTWIDKTANAFAILGISAPAFFAGIIIAWFFGFVLSEYTGLNMSGRWFASLLAGSFFVEYVFGYNGLGRATVNALEMSDFPVVMGSILFIALIFVLINILVDILYAFVDPRVKLA
eukprot:gene15705-18939_t